MGKEKTNEKKKEREREKDFKPVADKVDDYPEDAPPPYTKDEYSGCPAVAPHVKPSPLSNLSVQDLGSSLTSTVSRDQCIAHLRLLSALADLRNAISKHDTLFGIDDCQANQFPTDYERTRALTHIQDKRWAVYVARAVDRFEFWWKSCVPQWLEARTTTTLLPAEAKRLIECPTRITWNSEILPPLGR
jgi:hypothetical protein